MGMFYERFIEKSAPAPKRRSSGELLDKLPDEAVSRMGTCLYILGALAWDYADSVIDLAIAQRRDLKIPSRMIRGIKADYDRVRSRMGIDGETCRKEARMALKFEELCRKELAKVYKGTLVEMRVDMNKPTPDSELIGAAQMALAVTDTMRLYAEKCDMVISMLCGRKTDHSILQDHFVVLRKWLIPYLLNYEVTAKPRVTAVYKMLREVMGLQMKSDGREIFFDVEPTHYIKCAKCGEYRHFTQYYRSKNTKSGFEGTCKECRRKNRKNKR